MQFFFGTGILCLCHWDWQAERKNDLKSDIEKRMSGMSGKRKSIDPSLRARSAKMLPCERNVACEQWSKQIICFENGWWKVSLMFTMFFRELRQPDRIIYGCELSIPLKFSMANRMARNSADKLEKWLGPEFAVLKF